MDSVILSDVKRVVGRLSELYKAETARSWLYARSELLGGRTAMELIREGRTDEVMQAIEMLDSFAGQRRAG